MRDELDLEREGSTVAATAEPISPELVLVSPDLRTLAFAELPDPVTDGEPAEAEAPEPGPKREQGLVSRLLLYAAWQTLVGALFGLAAFAAFATLAVGAAFLAR